jgi:hypothetical protein
MRLSVPLLRLHNITRQESFFGFSDSKRINYFEDLEQKSYSFSNRFMLIWRFKFYWRTDRNFDWRIWLPIEELVFRTRSVGRFAIYFCKKAKHYYFQRYRRATKTFILAKKSLIIISKSQNDCIRSVGLSLITLIRSSIIFFLFCRSLAYS